MFFFDLFLFIPFSPPSGPVVFWSLGPLVRGSVVTLVFSTIPYKLRSSLHTDTLGPRASVGRRLEHIHCKNIHAFMHAYIYMLMVAMKIYMKMKMTMRAVRTVVVR